MHRETHERTTGGAARDGFRGETTVTCRALEAGDIHAAIELWRRTPGIGLSQADEPDELERFLRANGPYCFGAWSAAVHGADEQLIGTILCGCDARRGYIYHLAVDERSRRQGVARELVSRVTEALTRHGIQKVHAMVFADNPEGRKAWAALGWGLRDDLVVYSQSLISE